MKAQSLSSNCRVIRTSILFNASEFDETLKLAFFKQLYEISKANELLFLYDYFKAPERLVDIENIDTTTLLDYYRFALQIAQKRHK